MKKVISIGLFLVTLAGLSSCTKNTVTEPKTITFETIGTPWVATGPASNANAQNTFTQSMSEITQAVVDNGAVLGFIKVLNNTPTTLAAGTSWASLPYTYTNSSYSAIINYQYDAGNFYVTRKDTDLILGSGNYGIKVVILTAIEKSMVVESGVDMTNYEAVMDVLENAAQ